MAKAKEYLSAILAGGLPSLLDYGSAAGGSQGDRKPETTPPEPTNRDIIPGFNLQTVTQNQILIATAAVVGVLGLIYLIRR